MGASNETLYDVAIIGAGPAGLTAAIYLARASCRVLVLEKDGSGGQIGITAEVANYPGVLHASGAELMQVMRQQALAFGAEFKSAEVTRLSAGEPAWELETSTGTVRSLGVLLATGARPRQLGFAGEDDFKGRGVAYCATCDGAFFAGLDVFVIGGGIAAAEEAMFLASIARKVTVVIRGAGFSCPESIAAKVQQHANIEVWTHTVLESVSGDTALRGASFKNLSTGEAQEYRAADGEAFGIFVFAGYTPETSLVESIAELNGQGYVVADKDCQTSVAGLYAAGDVREKRLRQLVTATADGAIAATALEGYAREKREAYGLEITRPDAPSQAGGSSKAADEGVFNAEMQSQLVTVFERMESALELRLSLDERPISAELESYMRELAAMTSKLSVLINNHTSNQDGQSGVHLPVTRIFKDGADTGLAFHGVPGGHEFNSFVLGLYNASGPGQALEPATRQRIEAIGSPVSITILVSLSCTMCPATVQSAQHIAALSPNVRAEAYDIAHFNGLKDKYQVMSVPCIVVSKGEGNSAEEEVHFGRQSVEQMLDLIGA